MSEAFQGHEYDRQRATLRVTFKDGSRYEYRIPPRVWGEFQRADSKGAYFQAHIRPRPARKL